MRGLGQVARVPKGYLPRPRQGGLVSSRVVSDLLDTIERLDGRGARAALVESVGPGARDIAATVPEEVAAALLRSIRRELPALSMRAQRIAARETAEALIAQQLSARGRTMLIRAPWPIAAWLVGRWADQNAWTFAGSGRFRALTGLEFEIVDSPFVRGEAASEPTCEWHAALFGHLFRRLVDPRLVCREMTCAAVGGEVCRFAFYLGSETLTPPLALEEDAEDRGGDA